MKNKLLLIYNGTILTMDEKLPIVSALLISGNRIIAAGDDQSMQEEFQLLASRANESELLDLKGKTVLPGFTDSHIHLEYFSLGLTKVDCETSTKEECLHRVKSQVANTPPQDWILGHGWNQNNWEGGYGVAADLDRVAPYNPVFLTAKSLHAAWVNSAALQAAGINANTADPPGGNIQRDRYGHPTGILFESAVNLVSAIIPSPSTQQLCQALSTAQQLLWKFGITSVHDFDSIQCFRALQQLNETQQLKLRVLKSIPESFIQEAINMGIRSGYGDDRLRIGGIKLFADGALGPRTAAMFQPYEGEPENRGTLLLHHDEIVEKTRHAVGQGISLAIHAIGDLANHEVLKAYQTLREIENKTADGKTLRHRIEHVQLIRPEDIQLLVFLNVIASMQPIHATSDMYMAAKHWGTRSEFAYAWRSLLSAGATLLFGSDAPVENPNPFLGIYAAITRQREAGTPPHGWYPEQKITLHQALHAFIVSPHLASGMQDRVGKLIPSYVADLIVLDKNPFDIAPEEIQQLHPLATLFDGEWVWRNIE
jgi:predicted amidohydrolase YtcJ